MSVVRRALTFARIGVRMAKATIGRSSKPEEAGPPKPLPRGEERDYTLAELRGFDGTDPERPVLFAAKGKVFDVTRGRAFYGAGGPYAMFAGKDCSRALAKMSFDESDFVGDLSGIDADEREKLDDWVASFERKYRVLGRLVDAHRDEPRSS